MFKNEPDLLTRKQCQDLLHISKSKMLDLIHERSEGKIRRFGM